MQVLNIQTDDINVDDIDVDDIDVDDIKDNLDKIIKKIWLKYNSIITRFGFIKI